MAAESPSALLRITYTMRLREGQTEAYIESHRAVWPDVLSMQRAHGVRKFSISLHPDRRTLFCYVEVESQERWAAIADTDECKRWWAYMANFVEFDAAGAPMATPLTEVFFQAD